MWYPPANEWQTNTKRSNRNRRRKVFAEMNKQNEENRNKAEKKHKSIRKMLCWGMWVRPNEEYHKNINMLIKMGIISQLKLEKKSDSDPTVNNHNNFQSSQKCDVAVAWFLSSWDYLPLFSSQRVCGNGQFPQCRPAIDGVLRAWE